jgi:predicted Na+-dependent transporter
MFKPIIDFGVSAPVILTMVAVGLGLTVGDLRRVVRTPGLVVVATVGQSIFLPLIALILIRRRWPAIAESNRRGLFTLSMGALAVMIGLVIVQEARHFAAEIAEISLAVTLLTGLAPAAGWATGWARGDPRDRFTVGLVFVVRNVGVATAIAVTVLGRIDFAVFASACFLSQAPLVLAAAFFHRRLRTAAPGLNIAE